MNGARLGHFCVLFLTLLCCTAGMLLACAANKIAVPSEVDGVEIKTIDPLEAFQKGYEEGGERVPAIGGHEQSNCNPHGLGEIFDKGGG